MPVNAAPGFRGPRSLSPGVSEAGVVHFPTSPPASPRHPPFECNHSGAMSSPPAAVHPTPTIRAYSLWCNVPPPSLPRSNSDSTPPGEMTSLGMEAKRAPKTIFRIVAQSIIPLWYELPLKLERKPFSKSAIPHLTSPTSDSRHPPSECNKPLWCNVSPTLHSHPSLRESRLFFARFAFCTVTRRGREGWISWICANILKPQHPPHPAIVPTLQNLLA